jgi:hypothetical protein
MAVQAEVNGTPVTSALRRSEPRCVKSSRLQERRYEHIYVSDLLTCSSAISTIVDRLAQARCVPAGRGGRRYQIAYTATAA